MRQNNELKQGYNNSNVRIANMISKYVWGIDYNSGGSFDSSKLVLNADDGSSYQADYVYVHRNSKLYFGLYLGEGVQKTLSSLTFNGNTYNLIDSNNNNVSVTVTGGWVIGVLNMEVTNVEEVNF